MRIDTTAIPSGFAALRDHQIQRGDRLMSAIGRQAARDPATVPALAGEAAGLYRAGAGHGGLPTFFQLRDGDGRVVRTVALEGAPDLPAVLPARLTPRGASAANPDGEVFGRVEAPGEGPPWTDSGWRIRSAGLPGGASS